MNKQCTCICHGNIRGTVTNRCEHCGQPEQDFTFGCKDCQREPEQVQKWEEEVYDDAWNIVDDAQYGGLSTTDAANEIIDLIRKEKEKSFKLGFRLGRENNKEKLTEK